MKRPYSHMSTSLLPLLGQNDPRKFKSVLDGTYRLKVIRATDISKPAARPIDEIDEPENEDEAREIKLNETSARMIQMSLKDSNSTEINAIETERIEMLNCIKPNWTIHIEGPVEVRCGNIMLEKKHVTNVEQPSLDEKEIEPPKAKESTSEPKPCPAPLPSPVINVDDDDDDPTIIMDESELQLPMIESGVKHEKPEVCVVEDWDEEFEEDDDCIIID